MPVLAQLGLDRGVVFDGVRAVERSKVENVHQQAAALDVGEELVAEPGAGAGPLDQARDVSEHELALVALERAEHGMQRGERVVGDLRLGPREAGEQRRLAGVRQPDQAGVGQQPQTQLEPALLARQPVLGEARRLARGRGEVLVAAPPASTARDQRRLAALGQIPAVPEL